MNGYEVKVLQIMKALGCSQMALAKRLGLSQSVVSHWLKGRTGITRKHKQMIDDLWEKVVPMEQRPITTPNTKPLLIKDALDEYYAKINAVKKARELAEAAVNIDHAVKSAKEWAEKAVNVESAKQRIKEFAPIVQNNMPTFEMLPIEGMRLFIKEEKTNTENNETHTTEIVVNDRLAKFLEKSSIKEITELVQAILEA